MCRHDESLRLIAQGLEVLWQGQVNLDHKLNQVLGHQLSQSKKEKEIMADVRIAQETLDADGDKLSALAVDLKSLIDAGNLSAADESKLRAGLDALTSLDTVTVPPPADVPPAV